MNMRSKAIRESARGQECVLCGAQDGTVVWAHLNGIFAGKGFGIKAHDGLGAHLCYRCHTHYDGQAGGLGRDERRQMGFEACVKTLARLFDAGWSLIPPGSAKGISGVDADEIAANLDSVVELLKRRRH